MLRTCFCDLFGIEHPIVNAPISNRGAGADLAGAVSAAGGLGLIGGHFPEVQPADQAIWLRAQIRAVRARTARPFGVGFIVPFLTTYGEDDLPRLALDEGVAVLALSFGDPTPYVAAAHAAGARVLVQVQTVAQARRAVAAGVDVVVAQGTDAGGHGGEIGTLSLVPAVVDVAGDVPVLAAGGIADGRGLAAALLLGAAGAWLGTRFVASAEWEGGERLRAAVVAAGTDDTVRTVLFDRGWELPFPAGIASRVIRNEVTDAWMGQEAAMAARPEAVRQQLDEAMAADPDGVWLGAGSAVGLIDAVEPAGKLVRRISADAERLLREEAAQFVG